MSQSVEELLMSKGYSNLSLAASGLCNKYRKVDARTSTANRIPRIKNRFCTNELIIDSGEIAESDREMYGIVQQSRDISFGVDQTDRAFIFYSPSSAPSTTPVTLSTATTNRGLEKSQFLPHSFDSESGFKIRTLVVDKKFGTDKWEVNSSATNASCYSDRCIDQGFGSILQWDINRGSVVQRREEVPHKCPGTPRGKIGNHDLYQKQKVQFHTSSDRQYNSPNLSCENGGNTEQTVDRYKQRNLVISFPTLDHNYSRIPTQLSECSGRLGVSEWGGFIGMETSTISVSENLSEDGPTRGGSICISHPDSDALHLHLK